jgi:hypothetical protein
MDDPTSSPPVYPRVVPPACPQCERATGARLEHLIRGDLITSNWVCTCGATWPADGDLTSRKVGDLAARPPDAIVLGDLHNLVAALDRRMPNGDPGRERIVAAVSANLREQAVERIAHLEHPEASAADDAAPDPERPSSAS